MVSGGDLCDGLGTLIGPRGYEACAGCAACDALWCAGCGADLSGYDEAPESGLCGACEPLSRRGMAPLSRGPLSLRLVSGALPAHGPLTRAEWLSRLGQGARYARPADFRGSR